MENGDSSCQPKDLPIRTNSPGGGDPGSDRPAAPRTRSDCHRYARRSALKTQATDDGQGQANQQQKVQRPGRPTDGRSTIGTSCFDGSNEVSPLGNLTFHGVHRRLRLKNWRRRFRVFTLTPMRSAHNDRVIGYPGISDGDLSPDTIHKSGVTAAEFRASAALHRVLTIEIVHAFDHLATVTPQRTRYASSDQAGRVPSQFPPVAGQSHRQSHAYIAAKRSTGSQPPEKRRTRHLTVASAGRRIRSR